VEDRAGVAAAHGDHHVSGLRFAGGQRFGELAGDVQADLGHGRHDGRVELGGGLGSGRGDPDPPGRFLVEQRGGHLGPAGVVGADE
jgi:hypothetical protein